MKKGFTVLNLLLLVVMLATTVTGCVAPTTATPAEVDTSADTPKPPAEPAPTQPEPTKAPEKVVNSAGIELPADAAPLDQQVLRLPANEFKFLSWDASVYDLTPGGIYGIHDPCTRTDKNFDLFPAGCESWEVSADGLTWTFKLPKDKVWSDGTPVTSDDWVFTLQRYARPDFDFEWFYSMAGIVNWSKLVKGEVPAEELGVKKVDDTTFSVTTDMPIPYIPKLFTVVWVVPKHIVKDRLADGSWSLDPARAVSAGPYKLDHYTKGKEIVWVANDKYTGPFPPMIEKIILSFVDPQSRFLAYKNYEFDMVGISAREDLPPAAMAEIMADPELQKQLITWPNFITNYLFFDAWNPPFDNLKVRQAFSHAIDRDAIVNGPLQYQASSAYTMNPPGFPGESVDQLKDVQKYDPELAKKLMEEAGFPGGKDFPKLTLYTRAAYPALTNAAEAIAGMLKENLGVVVEIQDLEYATFSERMKNQKKDGQGDFNFALVSYEFDFVDGSNLLGVWGGCEPKDAQRADMPGRHTWYNQEFNTLMCQAQTLMGNEDQRNELYKKAEKILVEDVGLVPIYHGVFNVMINPKIVGPAKEPNKKGMLTFWRYEYAPSLLQVYRQR